MAAKQRKEPTVKCTIKLPENLWRKARIRALDERTEFQAVVARALEMYLMRTPLKRQENEDER